MQRARVDLPQPVSPDQTEGLPPLDLQSYAVHRMHHVGAAPQAPGLNGEVLDDIGRREQYVVAHRPTGSPTTRALASARPDLVWGSQQADRWVESPSTGSRGGVSRRHLSNTYGQRGWNGHPAGGWMRLGG